MKRALVLLILLFVTACGQSAPEDRPLYQGSTGVELSFPRENARTLYAEDLFTVSVRMENDGAADAQNGWLTVIFDQAVFRFNESKVASEGTRYLSADVLPMSFTIRGRSRDVIVGEVDYADFTFQARAIQGNRDRASSTITFQACYPYETTFIGTVCIDRDVYNTELSKVCIGHTVSGSNQGAPVAVTRVEPSFLYQGGNIKPRFKVTLTNLQDGYTLWNEANIEDSRELCDQKGFDRQEFGKVKVTASINNIELVCGTGSSKDGVTRFDGRTAEVLCMYPDTPVIAPGANYEAPIVVQAQYFYVTSLTAEVEVNNV